MRVDYIRFVTSDSGLSSTHRSGLFHIASDVRRDLTLSSRQKTILDDGLLWFSENLVTPDLDVSGTESWFKCSAAGHISRARGIAEVLRELGISIAENRTEAPGTILYEDCYQVVSRSE